MYLFASSLFFIPISAFYILHHSTFKMAIHQWDILYIPTNRIDAFSFTVYTMDFIYIAGYTLRLYVCIWDYILLLRMLSNNK